ncbi:hypothetical protein PIB30_046124, partial [Stylosanthes scabra]|nr:hypothetical protein [Stylosanthes scabra]
PPPRRSLEIRATLKILVEAEVFLLSPSTLNPEELIREALGQPNSSSSAPEQYIYITKKVRPSENFADELFQDQCARTKDKHFSFHKNLQCSSDLQGTEGGGSARPLRRSSQIGRTLSD